MNVCTDFKKQISQESGFSLIELLVALLVLGILSAIAFPKISGVHAQLSAGEDLRAIARSFQELRAEAIRTRQHVRVDIASNSVSWDFGNDGSVDGSYPLNVRNSITGSLPASFTFSGMGLARGINGPKTFSVTNSDYSLSAQMNSNGYIKF